MTAWIHKTSSSQNHEGFQPLNICMKEPRHHQEHLILACLHDSIASYMVTMHYRLHGNACMCSHHILMPYELII